MASCESDTLTDVVVPDKKPQFLGLQLILIATESSGYIEGLSEQPQSSHCENSPVSKLF
jgi:hypothetical protein